MAGLTGHWWLILLILLVVLIIWGPGKLPDVGAGMGRAIREFRKASTETKDVFTAATAPLQQAPVQQAPAPTPPAADPGAAPASPAPSEQSTVSG